MKIVITLSEVLNRCDDWEAYCEEYDWSEWCVNEGYGNVEVYLSEDDARRHGII